MANRLNRSAEEQVRAEPERIIREASINAIDWEAKDRRTQIFMQQPDRVVELLEPIQDTMANIRETMFRNKMEV